MISAILLAMALQGKANDLELVLQRGGEILIGEKRIYTPAEWRRSSML